MPKGNTWQPLSEEPVSSSMDYGRKVEYVGTPEPITRSFMECNAVSPQHESSHSAAACALRDWFASLGCGSTFSFGRNVACSLLSRRGAVKHVVSS